MDVLSKSKPAQGGLFGAVKHLGFNSIIYTTGNLLTRGLSFLLIPILTQALTRDDYGILAITTTSTSLLTIVIGFCVESAVTQLYFHYATAEARRSFFGTLLLFLLVVPGIFVLLLDWLGRAGHLEFFPSVPFDPYLRMTLWISYAGIFFNLLQTIYITMQRSIRVMILALFYSLLTISLNVYFVVFQHQGARGSLLANLLSASAISIVAIALIAQVSKWAFSWSQLKASLAFSLPLLPHLGSNWALNLSDRIILERFVSTAQIGIYSLSFQFGQIVSIFANSINNAFFPIVNINLSDKTPNKKVPALGTYAVLAIAAIGLATSLLGIEAIKICTPSKFHQAADVLPWFALAFVFQGVYFVWSRGTWISMRTGWMPVLTAVAASVNVALNIWLVPTGGIHAAACNSAIGFGVLALLQGWLASRVYRIEWEYCRWVKILAAGFLCFMVGQSLNSHTLVFSVFGKLCAMALFPLVLLLTAFYNGGEIEFIKTKRKQFFLMLKKKTIYGAG